jgi:hypothetical protein
VIGDYDALAPTPDVYFQSGTTNKREPWRGVPLSAQDPRHWEVKQELYSPADPNDPTKTKTVFEETCVSTDSSSPCEARHVELEKIPDTTNSDATITRALYYPKPLLRVRRNLAASETLSKRIYINAFTHNNTASDRIAGIVEVCNMVNMSNVFESSSITITR